MEWHVPVVGRNRWCGPGALAILLGLTTDEAAARLRKLTGRRAIFGVAKKFMLKALVEAGMKATPAPPPPWRVKIDPPLEDWATWPNLVEGCYLVNITGHYVVVNLATKELCDNKTVYPLALARYRGRRKRVRAAWRITPAPRRVR